MKEEPLGLYVSAYDDYTDYSSKNNTNMAPFLADSQKMLALFVFKPPIFLQADFLEEFWELGCDHGPTFFL